MGPRNPFMNTPVLENPPWSPIDLFLVDGKVMVPKVEDVVNLNSAWFWICIGSILFNPLFWNSIARNEYRNKTMTKIFGSPKKGTYALAVIIFSLGIIRDYIFKQALAEQPSAVTLAFPAVQAAGIALFVAGQILVLTSIYALGITGTYLGDYFGILMSKRVTGFPFNIMENPMYNGSTLCFIGTAIWYQKPAGLIISAIVFVVYEIALAYEGPFTDKIYSGAAKKTDTTQSRHQTTPAKSTRAITPPPGVLHTPLRNSAPKAQSYAAAAAEAPRHQAGLKSVDPRPIKAPIPSHIMEEEPASPLRVTRSRSRARLVEDD